MKCGCDQCGCVTSLEQVPQLLHWTVLFAPTNERSSARLESSLRLRCKLVQVQVESTNRPGDCLLMLFPIISIYFLCTCFGLARQTAYMLNPKKHELAPPAALVKSSSDCWFRQIPVRLTPLLQRTSWKQLFHGAPTHSNTIWYPSLHPLRLHALFRFSGFGVWCLCRLE